MAKKAVGIDYFEFSRFILAKTSKKSL